MGGTAPPRPRTRTASPRCRRSRTSPSPCREAAPSLDRSFLPALRPLVRRLRVLAVVHVDRIHPPQGLNLYEVQGYAPCPVSPLCARHTCHICRHGQQCGSGGVDPRRSFVRVVAEPIPHTGKGDILHRAKHITGHAACNWAPHCASQGRGVKDIPGSTMRQPSEEKHADTRVWGWQEALAG